jgi:hypothetical protein
MLNLSRDLLDLLQARASDGRKAFALTDAVFTNIITALRRNPCFANLTTFKFELLLADARREMEQALFTEMAARMHLDDAANAVEVVLGNNLHFEDLEYVDDDIERASIFDGYLDAQLKILSSNPSE